MIENILNNQVWGFSFSVKFELIILKILNEKDSTVNKMGNNARKPVFRFFERAGLKPGSSAIEASYNNKISYEAS